MRTKYEHAILLGMSRSAAHLLTRSSHRTPVAAGVVFLGDLTLATARVHEICGRARRTLALTVAKATEGPVFWISPGWSADRLNAAAMIEFVNPGRFTFVTPKRPEDVLWSMEEILRSGTVPLVIADLPAPPSLTPVRRLHLAAETGAAEGRVAPLGLLLTPGEGGASGVESRWGMAPSHDGDRMERWKLSRRRARTAPMKDWGVTRTTQGLALFQEQRTR